MGIAPHASHYKPLTSAPVPVPAAFFDFRELVAERASAGRPYHEFLRVASMSAGVYVLPKGAEDPQQPHGEDEVYHVVRGRARLRAGETDIPVEPGTIAFVPARMEHRFHDIEEELEVVVFFAPAEGSRTPGEGR